MCETCGCNITPGNEHLVRADGKHARTEDGRAAVTVLQSLLAENDHQAEHNREHFLRHNVLAINLMGSPGSGKTAVLEATARALGSGGRLSALSGDLATDNDASRLQAAGIPSLSITTGSACHLDARLVHRALHDLDWHDAEMVFIENVGNLVCPAVYDLGQALNVVALSVTEGEDKPLKYPVMFRTADLVLLTKVDLLPHLPHVDVAAIESGLARTMPEPAMIRVSATTGEGIDEWLAWLEKVRTHKPAAVI
jgi:hydrogenase nickel incorporation protein HypB